MSRFMSRLLAVLLVAGLAGLPAATVLAEPATAAETPAATSSGTNYRLLAVGAGAIVGVVAFNMLTYPWGSVPFVAGSLAATPVDIALGSRLLAVVAGGAAALGAHYLYD